MVLISSEFIWIQSTIIIRRRNYNNGLRDSIIYTLLINFLINISYYNWRLYFAVLATKYQTDYLLILTFQSFIFLKANP